MFHDDSALSPSSWRELTAGDTPEWDLSWVPTEVRDAAEWLRALDQAEPNNLVWRRRVLSALRCMRDGLVQKDLELGTLSGWERDVLEHRVPGLRVRARSALVKIGVILAGLTSLDPRDIEHGLARIGADVAAFLEDEADAYLCLEAAQLAPLSALRRAKSRA